MPRSQPFRICLAAALLPTTLWACGNASGSDFPEPPLLETAAELRVGSVDDSATAFTWFRSLTVGADGRIYSLHPSETVIRVHDAQGRPLGRIGREGAGPGEFRNPGELGWRADTLWVLDYGNYRFNLYDADGEYLGVRTIPVDLGGRGRPNPPRPNGMLADGTIWGTPPAFSHEVAEGRLTRNYSVRFDSAGAVADTIAEYSVANTTWRLADPDRPRGLQSFREQPFADTELVSVSDTRLEVVRVDRTAATTPERGEFHVMRLTLDGDTLFARTIAYVPRPIPASLPDSLARVFASGMANLPAGFQAGAPTEAKAFELARATLYVPAYFPPVRRLLLGRDATLWLQREEIDPDIRTWWVLDEQGRLQAAVNLPAAFTMLAAEMGRVWGTENDELDVPYLVSYRIGGARAS